MKIANGLIGLATALYATSAIAADLSPARWPTAERAELQTQEFFSYPAFAGPVDGARILVTGTASPVAVHAGAEVLRRGGTAADAAATVALTQIATNHGSVVSYAGVMQLAYFEAKTGKVSILDGGWNSYVGETDVPGIPQTDLSVISGLPPPPAAGVGELGRQTLVPGFMAGIEAMHQRFGRLPFADLLQPAIWYAENGAPVGRSEGYWFQQRQPRFWRTPEGRAFASMPDGALPRTGDLLRQRALAQTLRAVAAQGASYMYTGDWAHAYVAAVRAAGGKATLEDMANYRAIWRNPASVPFAGAQVYGMGESPSACPILMSLNLLSAAGADRMGAYWQDPKALRTYLRTLTFAIDKSIVPWALPPETAAGLGSTTCKDWLTPAYAAAVAPQLAKVPAPPAAAASASKTAAPIAHSDSVVVVDRWGNVAALVHSLNALSWGDTGIVVGGVTVSDAAAVNRIRLASVTPGGRVPTEMAPVIALRDGKPVLAIATIGSSLMAETTRLAATLLANRADLQSTLAATPLVTNFNVPGPGEAWAQPELVEAGAYGPDMLAALRAGGLEVQEIPTPRVKALSGGPVVAVIDQPSGAPHAVEVPDVYGFAETDRQIGLAPPKSVALPAAVLDRYVGAYQLGPRAITRVEREGERLFAITNPGAVKVELFARSDGRFFERDYDVQVSFQTAASGHANSAAVRRNGIEIEARRIDLAEAARIEALPPVLPVLRPPLSATSRTGEGVDASGDWITTLSSLRIAFHIRATPDGVYEASCDSPDSGAFDVPTVVSVKGETLSLHMPSIGAQFEGQWRAGDAQWVGHWSQSGPGPPMTLSRGQLAPLETIEALTGTWDSAPAIAGKPGPSLLFRFRTRPGHGTSGSLDLPDLNSRGAFVTQIHRAGDRVSMRMETIGAAIDAKLSPDGKTMDARYTALGVTTPVILMRRAAQP
ncbi:gamma-glutamyltransferase [Phenylobacterium sp.]|jgi:gamma-glutamyltranspeptidase/glutathione hydrolase|uniref:gamma-glutamyltransferase n=1 Tax=Phenylobacterium sp. TaxID=1871053 RepID=UPI002E36ED83|nr:gamma-glutamyltransferase [Phenylobacterium sp.]HEX3367206.1 gamma-glutamyltransferase [Phenylobacterium sp.]